MVVGGGTTAAYGEGDGCGDYFSFPRILSMMMLVSALSILPSQLRSAEML